MVLVQVGAALFFIFKGPDVQGQGYDVWGALLVCACSFIRTIQTNNKNNVTDAEVQNTAIDTDVISVHEI